MSAKLNRIPVEFNQLHHTYTNTETGEVYNGITSTLLKFLFPDKYKNIPEEILKKAAEKGTMVHEEIELAQSIGIEPNTDEARNYLKLRDEKGLKYLTSEYTVSDLDNFATNIDVIYDVDDTTVDIGDFKTTYKLDRESCAWQLSICARFLEINNPEIKVRKLYAIWLRGDIAELIEVPRKPDEEIHRMIMCYLNNEPFDAEQTFPDYFRERELMMDVLSRKIKEMTGALDAMKAELLEEMEKHGDKSFDTGGMLVTYVAPSKRSTFESKKFQKEHEDLYGQYMKESSTKASLKITIR